MQFFVRFDIRQPEAVPNADLVEIWKREAAAALGAKEAGAVTHLWKVAGQRVVLAVVDFPSAEDLDRQARACSVTARGVASTTPVATRTQGVLMPLRA